MSLPEVPQIASFLADLALVKPREPGYVECEVSPPRIASNPSGLKQDPGIRMWYRPRDQFTIDSMIARIEKELEARQHPFTKEIAALIIALFAINPAHSFRPIQTMNEQLEAVVAAELRQFYVLPFAPPPGVKAFSFGSFNVSIINTERIKQRTLQAGSPDFFDLYGQSIRGKWSFEREKQECRVVDNKFTGKLTISLGDNKTAVILLDKIVSTYFQSLAEIHMERFWRAFRADQELQVVFGAPFIDNSSLVSLGGFMISVYQFAGAGKGWVAPLGNMPGIDFAQIDKRIAAVQEAISSEFSFKSYKDTAFDGLVKLATDFMFTARLYIDRDRWSEGFLHYVISLDLLFGEREESTKSVSRRVATIVYRSLHLTAQEAERRINDLYNRRSRYVHGGQHVTRDQSEQIERICRIVAATLYRVRVRDEKSILPEFVEYWRVEIDRVWATLRAGREVEPTDLKILGIE